MRALPQPRIRQFRVQDVEGLGRLLVIEVEAKLVALGCPKTQLMVRTENRQATGFYRSLGYEENDVINLGKRLIADTH